MELFNNVTEQSTSQELHVALKEGLYKVSAIDHNAITSRQFSAVFCAWRQKLCSLVMWYGDFVKCKDYSSGVNAAMALGKFGETTEPDSSIVEDKNMENISKLCEYIWSDVNRGNRAD